MSMIEIAGEKAIAAFDPDIQKFRGEFVSLNGGADFYAENLKDLIGEGQKSLAVFLDLCKENGIEPRRRFSGRHD